MNCSGFFLCPSLHFKTSYPYRPRNLWRVRYWSHCLPLRICGLVVMETSYFSKNCSYWSVARRKWPSECEEERGLGSPVKWPGLASRKAAHSKHLGGEERRCLVLVRDFSLHFGLLSSFGTNWKELLSCLSCQILGAWSWHSCQLPSSVQFRDTQQRGSSMNYLLLSVWIKFCNKKLRHFWQRCLFAEKDFDETLNFLWAEPSDGWNSYNWTRKENKFCVSYGNLVAVKLWQPIFQR